MNGPLVAYGGAGYILSVGLLKQISPKRARVYYDHNVCNGCDCYISRMLWSNGIAFTDPGLGFTTMEHKKDHLRKRYFSDYRFEPVLRGMEAKTLKCDEDSDCQWFLQVPVSQHLNARHFTHTRTHIDHDLHWIEAAANCTRHSLTALDKLREDLRAKGLIK